MCAAQPPEFKAYTVQQTTALAVSLIIKSDDNNDDDEQWKV